MDFKKEIKDGSVVCCIDGEITLAVASEIKVFFSEILAEKPGKVLLNFSKVKYIDSLGMATLIAFMRNLKEIGASFGLSNVEPKIISILKITKVDRILTIYDNEEQALSEL